MLYKKNDTITDNPFPNVINVTLEYILNEGWTIVNEDVISIDVIEWHKPEYHTRLIVSAEIQNALILNKLNNEFSGSFPEAQFLLNHFKERNFDTVFVDSTAYVYMNSVLPEHVSYLNKYGIIIENK